MEKSNDQHHIDASWLRKYALCKWNSYLSLIWKSIRKRSGQWRLDIADRPQNPRNSSTYSSNSFDKGEVVRLALTWQLVIRVVRWLARCVAMVVATSPPYTHCSTDCSTTIYSLFVFCCWNVAHEQAILFWDWNNLPNLPTFNIINIQLVNSFGFVE
jgi:hypothetical protein